MPTVVIPFAGAEGKTRLDLSPPARREVSLAMLEDVLTAALALGSAKVVTPDPEGAALARRLGAEPVADPGEGQGPAVAAGLAGLEQGAVLVVNADLPCAAPADLRALLEAVPAGGLALVEAADGTTNALGLSTPALFAPLYGPGSAARFRRRAARLGLASSSAAVPNLADDVDTLDDLRQLHSRLGPHSLAALAALPVEAVL